MGTSRRYRRMRYRRILTVRTYAYSLAFLGVGVAVLYGLRLVSWWAGLVLLASGTVMVLLAGILRKEITFYMVRTRSKEDRRGGSGR